MAVAIHSISEEESQVNIVYNYPYINYVSVVAALGGLLFGFDTAVISGTIPYITSYFILDDLMLGWAVSSILAGCAIGAAFSGYISEKWGRKKVLLICSLLFGVSALGTGVSESFNFFIFNRILGGIAVGIAAMIAPMYIAEITPAKIRGRQVSLYQLAIMSGILLAFISNYFLSDLGESSWRWMFSVQIVPSLLFFFALIGVSESPRWLLSKGKNREALGVFEKIGGIQYAKTETKKIATSFISANQKGEGLFSNKSNVRILMLGIMVAVFSQVTGYNSILYYAPYIFDKMGVSTKNALFQTLLIGIINVIFTFVALRKIEKTGRKKLLISGSMVMGLCWFIMAFSFKNDALPSFILPLSMLIFIAGFAATLGPVTWVYISEIYPNRIRAKAMSITTLSLWISCFITSFSFPVLAKNMGEIFTFSLYGAFCVLYFILILMYLLETKGKSLEELEVIFRKRYES